MIPTMLASRWIRRFPPPIGSCVLALAFLFSARASGEPVRLATGSEGGSYFSIGAELARLWAEAEPPLEVLPRPTNGSNENLALLAAAEADLALVTEDAVYAYLEQRARHRGQAVPDSPFCLVGPLYVGAAQFILRSDRVRTGTLGDLAGVLFYPGAAGSGTQDGTTTILSALGIRPIFVPPAERTLGYEAAAAALARGEFAGATLSGGPPLQAVHDLFAQRPGEFTILSFTPKQVETATGRVPGLVPSRVPAGTYPGQSEEVSSVGKRTLLIARTSLDRSIAPRLADAIERAIAHPNRGLRRPGGHPVLHDLDLRLWRLPLALPRCNPPATR